MRRRTPSLAAALVLLSSATASAQALRVTPAGDPSVRSDTIYKLAVKAADYPDQPYVYLLDDGIVRYETDGRGRRTYRQVIQVLTPQAAETWGEQSFSYVPSRERLTVNWYRVVGTDGRVISARPTHVQESLAPVAASAPVYSDVKIRRMSLGGVAPGTIVDYSYTVETLQPVVPGDWTTNWSVSTGRLTRRSRFVLDLPATLDPRIEEHHLTFARKTDTAAGRRVYTWAAADVQRPKPGDPFAPDSSGGQWIAAAAPSSWAGIARWYAGLSRDRYALTPALERRLSDVVAGSRTLDDSLRAVHRWVAQDFRYVSLSLGIGGFRPRTPASVLATMYGDCKDKATLFVALASRMGLTAYPVLLSSSGGVNRAMPSAGQFDHMIAAVQRPGTPGYLYLDLTADITPYGSLPPDEQGEFGLVVHRDGAGEEITFPEDSASANRSETTITGELLADGTFNGRYVERAAGSRQYGLRSAMTVKLDSTQRAAATRSMGSNVFEGGTGDSLTLFDGRDLRALPEVSFVVRGARAITPGGGSTSILTIPLPSYASPSLATELASHGARTTPIDVAKLFGPQEVVSELTLTLPDGWHAKLPQSVHETSAYGRYDADYAQNGRTLRVVRRMSGRTGLQPATAASGLLAWVNAVGKDDAKYIVLDHQ